MGLYGRTDPSANWITQLGIIALDTTKDECDDSEAPTAEVITVADIETEP